MDRIRARRLDVPYANKWEALLNNKPVGRARCESGALALAKERMTMVSRVTPSPKPPKARNKRNVMTGIALAGQMPALEHAKNGHEGRVWRVWLSYDDRYENGVYLQLGTNGDIFRYVVVKGHIKKAERIKDED